MTPDTFVSVLEGLAMVFVEPTDDLPAPDELLVAHIRFSGPNTGELQVAASAAAVREVTGGFTGLEVDEDTPIEELADMLGELSNVFLGNLLPEIAGEDLAFVLHAPQVTPCADAAEWERIAAAPEAVFLEVMDEPLVVHFGWDTPPAA